MVSAYTKRATSKRNYEQRVTWRSSSVRRPRAAKKGAPVSRPVDSRSCYTLLHSNFILNADCTKRGKHWLHPLFLRKESQLPAKKLKSDARRLLASSLSSF